MYEDIKTEFVDRGLAVPSFEDVVNQRWVAIIDQYSAMERWEVFAILSDHMSDEEYGSAVRHVWTHSEGDFDESRFDAAFVNTSRPINRDLFMTVAERQDLEQLPDPVTIYRGCQEETRGGVCWTTDLACAREFAQRAADESQDGKGLVLIGQCSKADTIAYFNAEGIHESEILTKQVSNVHVHEEFYIENGG
jgi:hypothetical protein